MYSQWLSHCHIDPPTSAHPFLLDLTIFREGEKKPFFVISILLVELLGWQLSLIYMLLLSLGLTAMNDEVKVAEWCTLICQETWRYSAVLCQLSLAIKTQLKPQVHHSGMYYLIVLWSIAGSIVRSGSIWHTLHVIFCLVLSKVLTLVSWCTSVTHQRSLKDCYGE